MVQMYYTTNSTPVLRRVLLYVLHGTQIQTTDVWLLQLRLSIGHCRSARTCITLSVNQVTD